MTQVDAAWIYDEATSLGASPVVAAVLAAIPGRESSYDASAESGLRASTGDYYSTGLYQENLGAAYGPGETPPAGLQSPDNIHGSQVQQLLGGAAYDDLFGNPANDVRAALALVAQDGFRPWRPQGASTALEGVPASAIQGALAAANGAVSLSQLEAAAGGAPSTLAGQTGNPTGTQNATTAGLSLTDPFSSIVSWLQTWALKLLVVAGGSALVLVGLWRSVSPETRSRAFGRAETAAKVAAIA